MILKVLSNSRVSVIKVLILFPNTVLPNPPILAKTGQFTAAKVVCISNRYGSGHCCSTGSIPGWLLMLQARPKKKERRGSKTCLTGVWGGEAGGKGSKEVSWKRIP